MEVMTGPQGVVMPLIISSCHASEMIRVVNEGRSFLVRGSCLPNHGEIAKRSSPGQQKVAQRSSRGHLGFRHVPFLLLQSRLFAPHSHYYQSSTHSITHGPCIQPLYIPTTLRRSHRGHRATISALHLIQRTFGGHPRYNSFTSKATVLH